MSKTVAIAQVVASFPLPEPFRVAVYDKGFSTPNLFTPEQMCSYAIEVSAPLLDRCQSLERTLSEHITAADAKIDEYAVRRQKAEQALRELVALKALKEEIDRVKQRRAVAFNRDPDEVARCESMRIDYELRKPLAWAAARAIVESK